MLLLGRVLNSDALVNQFLYISSVDYIPGTPIDVVIQLWDPAKNLRWVAGASATLKMIFNKNDGTEIEKSASLLDSGDRSIWKCSLTAAETEDLLSGNFTFELDTLGDATIVWTGLVSNGIRNVSGSC